MYAWREALVIPKLLAQVGVIVQLCWVQTSLTGQVSETNDTVSGSKVLAWSFKKEQVTSVHLQKLPEPCLLLSDTWLTIQVSTGQLHI